MRKKDTVRLVKTMNWSKTSETEVPQPSYLSSFTWQIINCARCLRQMWGYKIQFYIIYTLEALLVITAYLLQMQLCYFYNDSNSLRIIVQQFHCSYITTTGTNNISCRYPLDLHYSTLLHLFKLLFTPVLYPQYLNTQPNSIKTFLHPIWLNYTKLYQAYSQNNVTAQRLQGQQLIQRHGSVEIHSHIFHCTLQDDTL